MSNLIAPPTPEEILAGGVVFLVLSIAVVGARFTARRAQGLDNQLDDWLTLPALLANVTICIIMIWGVAVRSLAYPTPQPPAGTEALDFANFDIQTAKKVAWSVELVQCIGLACTKISFLLFYRRIFCNGKKSFFHWLTIILIIISAVWGVSFFFAFIAECHGDLAAWWTTIRTLDDHCYDALQVEWGFAVSDTIVDIAIFVTPMVMVWTLQMSTSRKIALTIVFGIGAMALAASIVRMIQFSYGSAVALKHDYSKRAGGADDSFTANCNYWAMIESSLSLISCCLPSIYKPVRDWMRERLQHRRRLHSGGSASNKAMVTSGDDSAPGSKPAVHKRTDVSLIFANQSASAEIESSAMRSVLEDEEAKPAGSGITVGYTIEQQEETQKGL